MAGFGAADVHRQRRRATTSIAVFGCGGVGNAAIAAARARGRAHDHRASTSTRGSSSGRTEFGATHTVDASKDDAVEAIRALTDGNGADVCIEAVGRPEVLKQAFYARDLAGTVVQVGVPTPDMALPDIPMIDFFGRGGALKPSLVRRLPPVARLPDAHRPLSAGPLPARQVRVGDDHARRRRGRVPQDGARRGAALVVVLVDSFA